MAGRFVRGGLAVLVRTDSTSYVHGATERVERAELFVVASAARDGSSPRTVREVRSGDAYTAYVSEAALPAGGSRGTWCPVVWSGVGELEPEAIMAELSRITGRRPWMATPEQMRRAIRESEKAFTVSSEGVA